MGKTKNEKRRQALKQRKAEEYQNRQESILRAEQRRALIAKRTRIKNKYIRKPVSGDGEPRYKLMKRLKLAKKGKKKFFENLAPGAKEIIYKAIKLDENPQEPIIPKYEIKRKRGGDEAKKKIRKFMPPEYRISKVHNKLKRKYAEKHGISDYTKLAVSALKPLIFGNLRNTFIKTLRQDADSGEGEEAFEDYMTRHTLYGQHPFMF